jgi:hypothetical protein
MRLGVDLGDDLIVKDGGAKRNDFAPTECRAFINIVHFVLILLWPRRREAVAKIFHGQPHRSVSIQAKSSLYNEHCRNGVSYAAQQNAWFLLSASSFGFSLLSMIPISLVLDFLFGRKFNGTIEQNQSRMAFPYIGLVIGKAKRKSRHVPPPANVSIFSGSTSLTLSSLNHHHFPSSSRRFPPGLFGSSINLPVFLT